MKQPLHYLATLLRWALISCAALLVLMAFYVSLGRELLPLLDRYKIELEDQASAALGVPVRVGRLEGSWSGLSPRIIARDVQIGPQADGPFFESVYLQPDMLASLLAWAPRIAHIQLDGARLGLEQSADGHWAVMGMPMPAAASSSEQDVATLLAKSQMLAGLSIFDSQLVLRPYGREPLALPSINLQLRNQLWQQRLEGRISLPDGLPVAFNVRSRLRLDQWQKTPIEVYLKLPQSHWAQWLEPEWLQPWRIEQLQAGAELWLKAEGLSLKRAVLKLDAPELQLAYADQPAERLADLSTQLFVQRQNQHWRVQLSALSLTHAEQSVKGLNALAQEGDQQSWQVQVDRFDLAAWRPLVESLAPLPAPALAVIQGLAPSGVLERVNLNIRPNASGAERFSFASNLNNVAINAYHGVPATSHVSGSISGDLSAGELRLNAQDFSLQLATLYPEPWRYQHAQARLGWSITEQAFTLVSPYIRLVGDEGQLAGDLLIRLNNDPADEDYMDLRVALFDGDARYTEKYLPTLSPGLSPALSNWLSESIKAGAVEEGFFLYQGSLGKDAPPEARAMDMFFRVKDVELAFQPGWPELRNADGDVFVEDSGVRISLSQGQVLDTQLSRVSAEVPLGTGKAPRLGLSAELDSTLAGAIELLQKMPIGTEEIFAGWQGSGQLDGHLQLDIPLAKGLKPHVLVDFNTSEASISLPSPALDISQISGAFRFDSNSGLSAPNVQAEVFAQPVKGRIVAQGRPSHNSSLVELHGKVAVSTLNTWLQGPKTLPVKGILPYRLRLTLSGADSQLRVDSNLEGVAIDLPVPFGKQASEQRYADWRMTLSGAERRYWADYEHVLSLSFAAPSGALEQGRGELMLGGQAARLPPAAGLRVRGELAQLDLDQWRSFWEAQGVSAGGSLSLFRDAQLKIDRLSGFGQQIEQVLVNLSRHPQAWALRFESEQVTGQVVKSDRADVPLQVDLKQLILDAPAADAQVSVEPEPDAPDLLADVDPASIMALDLTIAHLQRGEQLLGAWSLKARPAPQGVRFEELSLELQGLLISGQMTWSGPPNARKTQYKGRLSGKNLGDVLHAWGYAPSLTSDSFRLDVDGTWPGSPAWFALKRLDGHLDVSLRHGQFVEAQGSSQALRVFGLLNFNSIGRRLRLDFSDLLDKGLSYDRIKGQLRAAEASLQTVGPLLLTGPSSNLELNGALDLLNDRIDAKLLVSLPVANNLPLAALLIGAPAIGGALFIADKLLGDKVARFASVQYDITGPISNPELTFDKPF